MPSTAKLRLHIVLRTTQTATTVLEYGLREARDWQAESNSEVAVDAVIVTDPVQSRRDETIQSQLADQWSDFETVSGISTTLKTVEAPSTDAQARTIALLKHFEESSPTRVIIGAADGFEVDRLRDFLGITTVELAPTDFSHRRRRLVQPGGLRRLGLVFGLTYGFYLALGGFTGGLDLVTGAISAAVVALSLSHVAFQSEPALPRTGRRLGRMVLFLPVLFWEITKANMSLARVILHPRLPIQPARWTYQATTVTGMERMVLANSITLTPGTLAIDVQGTAITVHSLTTGAREDLESDRLARLIAWVFHGRGEGHREKPDGEDP